jgi:catechol 2,3-dioxygenase-like lactoylglutathione lyase family enzyme
MSQALTNWKIHHIGLSVSDMDQSLAWYRDHFGFEKRSETVVDNGNRHIVYIAKNGFELELFHIRDPKGMPTLTQSEIGPDSVISLKHIAFEVEDVDVTWQELTAAGHQLHIPPTDNTDLGVRYSFIKDPDGHLLEFLSLIK